MLALGAWRFRLRTRNPLLTFPAMNTAVDDVEIRRLLNLHRGQWGAIVLKSGISHSWLSKFVREKIPNPGHTTLKRLHMCFRELKLPVPNTHRVRQPPPAVLDCASGTAPPVDRRSLRRKRA